MTFRLGPFPVRIHGFFWLTALMLGANLRDPRFIALWVAVVFVSVLLHELGHAVAGRSFGLAPAIELHGMGGTTSWGSEGRALSHGRSIVVSLAGPLTGIVLGAAIRFAQHQGWQPTTPYVGEAAILFAEVNLYWGVLNLVPLLPLDGGNVMRSFLQIVTRGRGEIPARVISILTAGAGLLYAIQRESLWIGMLSALFAMNNVRAIRAAREAAPRPEVDAALAEASQLLTDEKPREALALLRPIVGGEGAPSQRAQALRMFAYGLLLDGHWGELVPLLEQTAPVIGAADLARYAETARALDRPDDAERIELLARRLVPESAAR